MNVIDNIFSDYKGSLNMSHREMINLYRHPSSKRCVCGRPKIRKNLKILAKTKSDLTGQDVAEMQDVIKNKYNFKELKWQTR